MKANLIFVSTLFFMLAVSNSEAEVCTAPIGEDCNKNAIADSCDIAAARSKDCNRSNKPDECELGATGIVVGPEGTRIGRLNDCNANQVPDECDPDCDRDGTPDSCELDQDKDNVPDDCETISSCTGQCNSARESFDEDQDGIPNCVEAQDLTDPCDSGSYIQRLSPTACGLPNGYFNQINIATVLNQLDTPLNFRLEYRDAGGAIKGQITFSLEAKAKRDVIVNDMGLVKDTYGTLCVFTDAQVLGAWSGGMSIYKRRSTRSNRFDGVETFDYALYYPFVNPQRGARNLPVNTNTVGTDGRGTVANWVRIADSNAGDGRPLRGTLSYFDSAGKQVGSSQVDISDGGRFDFGPHAVLGANRIGLAQFVPSSVASEYYIETTRYFYEGVGASSDRFYTAFPVPTRALTGETSAGKANTEANEISVIEMVNGSSSPVQVNVETYNSNGGLLQNQQISLAQKSSFHKVLTSDFQSSTALGGTEVTAERPAILATSIIYGFDSSRRLLYAYAPAFSESAGAEQVTEFNSFINHRSTLEMYNASNQSIQTNVEIVSYDQKFRDSFAVTLAPRQLEKRALTFPPDTYGTILLRSNRIGLVVRNDVSRVGQYVMPFLGR